MGINDIVPDAKTIWQYEDMLSESGAGKELFDMFYAAIVDASFMEAPRRKKTKEQREALKSGEIPEEWDDAGHPQKIMQRDIDATWVKKGNEAHFGYKDHVKVDKDSKLIADYNVTTASSSDVKGADGLFDATDKVAYGDSAYPSLKLPGNVENKISEKASRNNPLTGGQKDKVRCRVEHVFAGMVQMVGGTAVRCKNLSRAVFNISMLNLLYNMRRVVSLENPTGNWVGRKKRLAKA